MTTINDDVARPPAPAKTLAANRVRTAGRAARLADELVERDIVQLLDDKRLLDLGAAVLVEMTRRFQVLFSYRPVELEDELG